MVKNVEIQKKTKYNSLTLRFGRTLVVLCPFTITYPIIWNVFKETFELNIKNIHSFYEWENLEIEHENISDFM